MRWAAIAFVTSRLFVLVCGVIAAAVRGWSNSDGVDAGGIGAPFSHAGNLLVAASSRWDSAFYLHIALLGYPASKRYPSFFPTYPLLIKSVGHATGTVVASPTGHLLIAGVLISLTAFFVALYLLHRLVALDFGRALATRTILLVAWFPMAFFFSAVYTESLFLALSVGSIYMARRGRWAAAGVLGGLAATTRPTGILLFVPLTLLWFYGPREDGPPVPASGWHPRYSWRSPRIGWLLLVPVGYGVVMLYMSQVVGDALAPLRAEREWHRHLTEPFGVVYQGLHDTVWAADRVLNNHLSPVTDLATRAALTDFVFVSFGVLALVAGFRLLPVAYWSYALVGLVVPLMYAPETGAEHWVSGPRYILVLFPLFISLAKLTVKRVRFWTLLGVFAVLLASYTSLFATWHWVA